MAQPVKKATVGCPCSPSMNSGCRSRKGLAVKVGRVRSRLIKGAGKRSRRPLSSGSFLNSTADRALPPLARAFISFWSLRTVVTPLPKVERPLARAISRRAAATISWVGTLLGHWAWQLPHTGHWARQAPHFTHWAISSRYASSFLLFAILVFLQ